MNTILEADETSEVASQEATSQTKDFLTEEQIDALIADAPNGNPKTFVPTDAAGVDWVLRHIAAHRTEAALIRENMELMARECDRKANVLEWKYGGPLQHFLQSEAADGKKKSVRLPHGVLGYRTKPSCLQVTDPAAALTWACENLPEAVIEVVDRKALAVRLRETGEVAAGARLTPAEEVFYIFISGKHTYAK